MLHFPRKGISHRRVHLWLVIIILFFSGTVVYATLRLTSTFLRITASARQNSELQKAAHELMNASDYLTEQVQRFTINGDPVFLEQYFSEAFESKRREEAIAIMDVSDKTDAARAQLQSAMSNSVKLMEQEYYAMRLVIDAKGYTDYPDVLKGVVLSSADAALAPADKIRRATELVLNDTYYGQKDKIRKDMQECLDEIDKLAAINEETELITLNGQIRMARSAVIVQALLVFFLIWLTTRLAINPVLNAVEQIKADNPIPERGSDEFRYLASAYNKMYQKNKSSLEHLNFKVSHDELTGAYNRVGYDYLLSSIDLKTSNMMLLDVDNFKNINDTYGHETGDKILIKLVNTLQNVFRDDDCICRIGGDEFVVFMVHSSNMKRKMIESKMDQINSELGNTSDGLPPVSISAGIVNGKDVTDTSHLFEKTDKAMYASKMNGKHTYTFYSK